MRLLGFGSDAIDIVPSDDAGRIETKEILPVRFSELDVVER